jgi:hypothetical protein
MTTSLLRFVYIGPLSLKGRRPESELSSFDVWIVELLIRPPRLHLHRVMRRIDRGSVRLSKEPDAIKCS